MLKLTSSFNDLTRTAGRFDLAKPAAPAGIGNRKVDSVHRGALGLEFESLLVEDLSEEAWKPMGGFALDQET